MNLIDVSEFLQRPKSNNTMQFNNIFNDKNFKYESKQIYQDLINDNNFVKNKLSFTLLNTINPNVIGKNLLFSPYNVITIFFMILNIFDPNITDEVAKVLSIDMTDLTDHNKINKFELDVLKNSSHKSNDELININFGTSLWNRINKNSNTSTVKNLQHLQHLQHLQYLQQYYFVSIKNTKKPINIYEIDKWVSESTNTKINSLSLPLHSNLLDSIGKYIIVNTFYFKGIFEKKFNFVYSDYFTTFNNTQQECKMMFQKNNFLYYEDEDYFQAIQLNYCDKQYSCIFILPQININLFTSQFNNKLWSHVCSSFDNKNVSLFVPKIKINYRIKLNSALNNIGIKKIFIPSENAESFCISEVIQCVCVEIDDIQNDLNGDLYNSPDNSYSEHIGDNVDSNIGDNMYDNDIEGDFPIEMKINKPFLLFIRHNPTNNILLMSKIESINRI
jgi:serine protease inhibitor